MDSLELQGATTSQGCHEYALFDSFINHMNGVAPQGIDSLGLQMATTSQHWQSQEYALFHLADNHTNGVPPLPDMDPHGLRATACQEYALFDCTDYVYPLINHTNGMAPLPAMNSLGLQAAGGPQPPKDLRSTPYLIPSPTTCMMWHRKQALLAHFPTVSRVCPLRGHTVHVVISEVKGFHLAASDNYMYGTPPPQAMDPLGPEGSLF